MATPKLTKKVISDYFRTDCERFLALSLYRTSTKEAPKYNMPKPIIARKSQGVLSAPGKKAEELIYKLLIDEFGSSIVNYRLLKDATLEDTLKDGLDDILFLCEAEFVTNDLITEFFAGLGVDVSQFKDTIDMSDMRPDIIVKLIDTDKTYYEVLVDGTLKEIPTDDTRTKLGVIDIKYTEQSNSGYDAEVVLYSMIFSLWLQKHNLDTRYVVTSDAGILTGALQVNAFTEECPPLQGNNIEEKYRTFSLYTSYVEFDQLAITLRKVLQEDIVKVLSNPENWENLKWHVGQKCGMCDWLAFEEWLSEEDKKLVTPQHCYLCSNTNDKLCKIPFVSRGMTSVFNDASISTVNDVASTNGTEEVYSEHTGLKKNSSILPKRAQALTGELSLEERFILSMPSYSSTSVCITVNFDPSTGITSSIGLYAYWREYSTFQDKDQYTNSKNWNEQFFTDIPNQQSEFDMLGRFLVKLSDIFQYAVSPQNNPHPLYDPAKIKTSQTYQMYFWDQSQFEQLQKSIGRHIGTIMSNQNLKGLVWMFPPEEILEDPFKITSQPITYIKDVLRQNIALTVPYEYTLFNVAKAYLDNPGTFNYISKAFYDPFSDAIPKDRLYEIWQKVSRPNYQEVMANYMKTTKQQALALYLIANKIRADLKPYLKGEANRLNLSVFDELKGLTRWPNDSQLWYLYDLLNEKYTTLESILISSTPATELEASYKAVILERRLNPEEKQQVLSEHFPDLYGGGIEIYTVSNDSKNTKIKDDASYLAVGYRYEEGLPNRTVASLLREQGIDQTLYGDKIFAKMKNILIADIKSFDRVEGYIAIKFRFNNKETRDVMTQLLSDMVININSDLCLMDIGAYPSSKNTWGYLNQIKNPPIACAHESSIASLGIQTPKLGGKSKIFTISKLLWDAKSLEINNSDLSDSDASESLKIVVSEMYEKLNDSQYEAVIKSLTKQLNIIWGPPGTGKTKTASVLLSSRIYASQERGSSLRILLTAPTYQACIELFERTSPFIMKTSGITTYALQSASRSDFNYLKNLMNGAASDFFLFQGQTEKDNPQNTLNDLRINLQNNSLDGITIILAATATLNSFYKAGTDSAGRPIFDGIGEYFDYVMLDEASQVDVASSLSTMFGLTDSAQFTLLGDHLQMPPIHKVSPPAGIEFMVGSILEYFIKRFDVQPSMLNINYRSSKKIVDFIKTVGYTNLQAENDVIAIDYLPTPRNANKFEADVNNNDVFKLLLDPTYETMAVTYEDGRSSQANEFEATLVAGTILEAYNNFDSSAANYDEWFWKSGIGVVTPHKAQKVAIAIKLYEVFPKDQHKLIDEAIDTVERFQGGQRKLILVSFGVGDPDIIAQEEEFLLNLNRTNVAISRAESKVIVFISENLIHHLPQDKEIIKTARAIKSYTHQYCDKKAVLPVLFKVKTKDLYVRYK
ncbi:MAG: DEAD/DEAH box helicase [Sulfurovaceae bacterium]